MTRVSGIAAQGIGAKILQRSVRWLATASIAFVALSALATAAAALDAKTIAGLWQFPNREVWIRIEPDGSVYQCRIATRSPLVRFTSKGVFKAPEQIVWEEIWGTEKIEHRADALTIYSEKGPFTYIPARSKMAAECN